MSAEDKPNRAELARDAKTLLRRGAKGALATFDVETGYPYASLVTLATDPAGAPVVLISGLARHTRNLLANNGASILIDATDGLGDPLEGGRVTIFGKMEPVEDEAIARRFTARHESAAGYAGFTDFGYWRMVPEGAHYIGGFGRIVSFRADEVMLDLTGKAELIAAERGMVEHMNEDHADAILLYATELLGAEPGDWRITSCDPEGCDLMLGAKTLRLDYAAPVSSPQEARKALVALVQEARAQAAA